MQIRTTHLFLLSIMLCLSGCGGGGGTANPGPTDPGTTDPGTTDPGTTTNEPPTAGTGDVRQPLAKAGPDIAVKEGTAFTLNGSGEDPEGGELSFAWEVPAGFSVANAAKANLEVTGTPDIMSDANFTFTLTVTDDKGNTGKDDANVTLEFVNRAPTANAGADVSMMEGTTLTLTGSGIDPEGNGISYAWTPPASFAFTGDDSATLQITATPDIAEDTTFTFDLTVTDANGLSHTDTLTLTLTPHNIPDAFTFTPNAANNAAVGFPVISPTVTLAGMEANAPISAANAEYSIDGGPWLSEESSVAPGSEVRLRASAVSGTPTVATLDVNGITADFTITAADPAFDYTVAPQTLNFAWTNMNGPDHYNIYIDPRGDGAFEIFEADVATNAVSSRIAVHRLDWNNAIFLLEACNADESVCSDQEQFNVSPDDSIAATTYVKSPTDADGDGDDGDDFNRLRMAVEFGDRVAISRDGNVMIVGNRKDQSNAAGVNQPWTGFLNGSGAVLVFRKNTDGDWEYEAYLKAAVVELNDNFGASLATNGDGSIIAIGAPQEDSLDALDATDNGAPESGAVYIFERTAGVWAQTHYLKAGNIGGGDAFGTSVALNDAGNVLLVGAPREAGGSLQLINGTPDEGISNRGAAYLFRESGNLWTQEAYIKPDEGPAESAQFGNSVAMNAAGDIIAIGAPIEQNRGSGIDSPEAIGSQSFTGTIYVLRYDSVGMNWTRDAYIKAPVSFSGERFGNAVALDAAGLTLAASGEGTAATTETAGRVYLLDYDEIDSAWAHSTVVTASNADTSDYFGRALALNGTFEDGGDGKANLLVAGAVFSVNTGESGSISGVHDINFFNNNNGATAAGAVYSFSRDPVNGWEAARYIKAINTEANDAFGVSVAMDGSGNVLAVGASGEDGGIGGINASDGSDDSRANNGAIYIY